MVTDRVQWEREREREEKYCKSGGQQRGQESVVGGGG